MMRRALAFGLLAAAPGALPPVGAEIPKLGSVLNSVLIEDPPTAAHTAPYNHGRVQKVWLDK